MKNELKEGIKYLEEYSNTLTDDAINYWKYHKTRFKWTLNLIMELVRMLDQFGSPIKKILDIGPSYQTILLERIFPNVQIDTLGFFDARYMPKGQTVHIQFDLNDTFDRKKWPDSTEEKYDIILMMEVIEHLYTSPKLVLTYLNEILQYNGFLVIQTPNAVSLSKRFKMLTGKNPYELIRENRTNPGHFREYTKNEIRQLAETAGFEVVEIFMLNYFNKSGLLSKVSSLLPGSLREGMTHIIKKKR